MPQSLREICVRFEFIPTPIIILHIGMRISFAFPVTPVRRCYQGLPIIVNNQRGNYERMIRQKIYRDSRENSNRLSHYLINLVEPKVSCLQIAHGLMHSKYSMQDHHTCRHSVLQPTRCYHDLGATDQVSYQAGNGSSSWYICSSLCVMGSLCAASALIISLAL